MAAVSIGIMQGRLSPKNPRRFQIFPWATWQDEFEHAARIGLDSIEWLFESERFEENPIYTTAGLEQILERVRVTGVQVETLCFDYFMPHPFFRVTPEAQRQTEDVLCTIIRHASRIGIRTILLPVLEEAAVGGGEDFE